MDACVDGVGAGVSFVTFPLQPKPHNCESEWVRRLWTLDGDYDVDDGAAADDDTNVTERSEVTQVSPTTEQTGRCCFSPRPSDD